MARSLSPLHVGPADARLGALAPFLARDRRGERPGRRCRRRRRRRHDRRRGWYQPGGAGTGGAAGSVGGTSAGGQGGGPGRRLSDSRRPPERRHVVRNYGQDTVTDRVTGLMWQRIVTETDSFRMGSEPPCRRPQLGGSRTGGHRRRWSWQPSSISAAFNPAIDTTTFPGAPVWFFGTSTGVYVYAKNRPQQLDRRLQDGPHDERYDHDELRPLCPPGHPADVLHRAALPGLHVAHRRRGRRRRPDQPHLATRRRAGTGHVENAKPYCTSLGGLF